VSSAGTDMAAKTKTVTKPSIQRTLTNDIASPFTWYVPVLSDQMGEARLRFLTIQAFRARFTTARQDGTDPSMPILIMRILK